MFVRLEEYLEKHRVKSEVKHLPEFLPALKKNLGLLIFQSEVKHRLKYFSK